MNFEGKPIGIGNLQTSLKRKFGKQQVEKIPVEESEEDIAQLAVDVYETNDLLIIVAPLAGIDADDVRIEITEDVVVIEGERENPVKGLAHEEDLLVNECYFGSFSRSIVLPEAVNSKRAKAEFKKNILVLSIPKLDNVRTRVIKVQRSD